MGLMVPATPRIMRMLNTLLPSTLPSASSGFFFSAAVTAVMSSGSEVPTATMVMEMAASLIPHARARF